MVLDALGGAFAVAFGGAWAMLRRPSAAAISAVERVFIFLGESCCIVLADEKV